MKEAKALVKLYAGDYANAKKAHATIEAKEEEVRLSWVDVVRNWPAVPAGAAGFLIPGGAGGLRNSTWL